MHFKCGASEIGDIGCSALVYYGYTSLELHRKTKKRSTNDLCLNEHGHYHAGAIKLQPITTGALTNTNILLTAAKWTKVLFDTAAET